MSAREPDEASALVDGPAPAAATEQPSPPPTEGQQQQPDDESTTPLPLLEPLFTLVTNATTNATVHPRVQYLFADDDTSVLSDPPASTDRDGRPHRAIVVDLAPAADGARWTVAGAASLSPDFAVTASGLTAPAPAHDDAAAAGGPVLRVEGVEREPVDAAPPPRQDVGGSGSSGAATRDDVEALANDFRRRMGVLRRVVGEAERRRQAMVRQQELLQEHQHQHAPQLRPQRDDDEAAKDQPADDEAGRRRGPEGQG